MTANELREVAQTYRYSDAVFVVVDSLPEPERGQFMAFLRGSACPVGDGKNSYAYVWDFERFLREMEL